MSIGVIVPEFFNSFFAEVITGIQEVMEPQGYHILISQSNEIAATELKNLLAMDAKMVDGIIISVTQDSESADFLTQLQEKRVPLVFFNRLCPGVEAPHVIFDDYKWAFNAVEHLIRQGYKRIAHLAGPKRLLLSQERERGYGRRLQSDPLLHDRAVLECFAGSRGFGNRRAGHSGRHLDGKRTKGGGGTAKNASPSRCRFCRQRSGSDRDDENLTKSRNPNPR